MVNRVGASMTKHDTLYTVDSRGCQRFWYLESEGAAYRSVAGLVDGKPVVGGWVVCTPKNEGRSNATSPTEQCLAEVDAEYRKKRKLKYYDELESASGAKYFAPMLAATYGPGSFVPGMYSQPKLDGIRCIANARGLWSRKGEPFALPHISAALAPLFELDPGLILDGELYNHALRDDFNAITSLVRKVTRTAEQEALCAQLIQYHVYDVPSVPDDFGVRAEMLGRPGFFLTDLQARTFHALCCLGPLVQPVTTAYVQDQEKLDQLYQGYQESGYEGQILRANAPYANKRTKALLKRKEFLDSEFPIIDVQPGVGNWAGIAKRVILQLPSGKQCGAGVRGTQAFLRTLLSGWMQYTHATVRYFGLTPDGVPRFPVVTAFHKQGGYHD